VDITIVDRKPVRVATRRYVGPFGEPLGRYWRSVVTPWLADHGILDCPKYGVPLDNPMSTPPDRCRYDCCVELPAGLDVPDGGEREIAGGMYVVASFKGTGAQIGPAWGGFFASCMSQGMEMDSARLAFEHYPRGAHFDQKTGVFVCEICLPVVGS
jgi:AraC family transcriptional regulator